jgi:hypothetical protein
VIGIIDHAQGTANDHPQGARVIDDPGQNFEEQFVQRTKKLEEIQGSPV